MTQTKPPRRRPIILWIGLGCGSLVLTACALPIVFFWVIPYADAAVCIPRAAQGAGVASNFQAIEHYIVGKTAVGTTRAEVVMALERLGPLQITQSVGSTSGETIDDIWINMCFDPLDNIEIVVDYAASDQVAWMKFLNPSS